MRRVLVAVAGLVGVLLGAGAATVLGGDDRVVLPAAREATVAREPVPAPQQGLLLAWTSGGLPANFAERVRAITGDATSVVRADTVWMLGSTDADGRHVDALPPGHAIPLDAVAFDCDTWAPLVPLTEATAVCGLAEDEVLLGATSAELRRLGAGATITLEGGRVLRVAGVVADDVVGAAELVLPAAGAAAAGVRTERYVLTRFGGDRAEVEAAIHAAVPDVLVRVRGPGETPWLRHGDAVLPPAVVKTQFGEWSARRLGDGRLELDSAWESAHLVTTDLPLIGHVRCHRAVMPALRSALAELADRGLVTALDRPRAGCWNPRTIAGSDQPSRHAWGIAIDLVPFTSNTGSVEVMERWGLTWGGHWLSPDPVHFEYVRPAKA